MNGNRHNYALRKTIFQDLSIAIALIIMGAPYWVTMLAGLFMFLPYFIPSEDWATVLYVITFIIYSIARPVLYVLALIATIKGEQDTIAICFYVVAGLQVFSMLKNLILSLMMMRTIAK